MTGLYVWRGLTEKDQPRPACEGEDPELFFSHLPEDIEDAKRICNGWVLTGTPPCPLRDSCRHAAIERGEQHGVFGGVEFLSPQARARIKARQRSRTREQKAS